MHIVVETLYWRDHFIYVLFIVICNKAIDNLNKESTNFSKKYSILIKLTIKYSFIYVCFQSYSDPIKIDWHLITQEAEIS